MRIHFWGVRGSVPSPLTPEQVQSKIEAVVSRIGAKDTESPDSRETFIALLSPCLFGSVGGNTPCVQVTGTEGAHFLLDAGTGITSYGRAHDHPSDRRYALFLSHLHWDHIQGLPFFLPLYNPLSKIDVYTAGCEAEPALENQGREPFFPKEAGWIRVKERCTFHSVEFDSPFDVSGMRVTAHRMDHPGYSTAYRFDEAGKSFVYATDVEITGADFREKANTHGTFFQNVDTLVLDAQYTGSEYKKKKGWGHSSILTAVDFALSWQVRELILFHHDPGHDDRTLYGMLERAKDYAASFPGDSLSVRLATEGMEVVL